MPQEPRGRVPCPWPGFCVPSSAGRPPVQAIAGRIAMGLGGPVLPKPLSFPPVEPGHSRVPGDLRGYGSALSCRDPIPAKAHHLSRGEVKVDAAKDLSLAIGEGKCADIQHDAAGASWPATARRKTLLADRFPRTRTSLPSRHAGRGERSGLRTRSSPNRQGHAKKVHPAPADGQVCKQGQDPARRGLVRSDCRLVGDDPVRAGGQCRDQQDAARHAA